MKKNLSDICKIISIIGPCTIMSIGAISLFNVDDDDAGFVLILANIFSCFLFMLAIKNMKIFNYTLLTLLIYFSGFIFIAIGDLGSHMLLIVPLMLLFFVFFIIKTLMKKDVKEKTTTKDFFIFTAVLSVIIVVFPLLIFFEK